MKCQKCGQQIQEDEWVISGFYDNGQLIHRDHITFIGRLWSGVAKGFSTYQYHAPIQPVEIVERKPMPTKMGLWKWGGHE
jgi:hypothetical protein